MGLPGSGAEAQIGQRSSLEANAQAFQKLTLVEVGQLLKQDGVINLNLHHTSPKVDHPRVGNVARFDAIGPGLFQVKSPLPAAPATSCEKPSKNIADSFRSIRLCVSRMHRGT